MRKPSKDLIMPLIIATLGSFAFLVCGIYRAISDKAFGFEEMESIFIPFILLCLCLEVFATQKRGSNG